MSIILIILIALVGLVIFGFIFAGLAILIKEKIDKYKAKKQLETGKGVMEVEQKPINNKFFEEKE